MMMTTRDMLRAIGFGLFGGMLGAALWGPVAELFGPNVGVARLALVVGALFFLIWVFVASRNRPPSR